MTPDASDGVVVDAATITAVQAAIQGGNWGLTPEGERLTAEAAVRAVLTMQRDCPNPDCDNGCIWYGSGDNEGAEP